MHEYSIAEALIAQVETEARVRQALAVKAVTIQIGALSGIDPRLLASAYLGCRGGTVCADAPLEILAVATRWECAACGGPASPRSLTCLTCGRPARLAEGGEILLDRLDIEVPDVR